MSLRKTGIGRDRIASAVGMWVCAGLLALASWGCSSTGDGESEGGSASGVEPEKGSCCANNDSAGCDNSECEEAVCAVNPSCCEVAWDALCVIDYVHAEDLCPGLCEAVESG